MLITKTMFLNYTRCGRYPALEILHNDKVNSKLSVSEYLKLEQEEKISELLANMFSVEDDDEIDLTIKSDPQLEALLDYYKEIEVIAAGRTTKLFGGNTIFGIDTLDQKSFNFNTENHDYLCYVDIFNETENNINIVEVKATTSRRFLEMKVGKDKNPLFIKDKQGIYHINYLDGEKDFDKKYLRLQNRYQDIGKYIYDLAVQRYFIEHTDNNKQVNYYLAILNHEYVYDGYKENNKRVYHTDDNGNDIITLINLNGLTKDMMPLIKSDLELLEKNIKLNDNRKCRVGKWCGLKSSSECKYKDICYQEVPKYNASYNFINFRSFKDDHGFTYDKYELINEDYFNLLDIPESWLNSENHKLQYECTKENKEYINKNKLKTIIDNLEYPIYHLDFEGFPCPLPRFKGERCYTQSVFEFSLHIEREEGVCDEIKDNIIFLAETFEDEREALAKALVENIDPSKGTMLAQYVPYEYGRIKELAELYPQYRDHLLKINEMKFDLLYIIKNKKEYFEELGFDSKDASTVNYYHPKLSGSYSIKKTLPVLVPHLSYDNLDVKNGTEALVQYAKYNFLSKEELSKTKEDLGVYCRQDTWAMVEILRKLRELANQ